MSTKTNLSVINIPNVTTTRFSDGIVNSQDYVSYGSNNLYPDYLWSQYTQCPTHQSIIDGKVDYICGDGVTNGDKLANDSGETIFEVFKKCALDQQIFGGYAMQIVYNKAGKIHGVYWADFSKLRISSNSKEIFWRDDWHSYNGDTIKYDAYNPLAENKTSQILYVKSYTCRNIYPIPCYIAAMDAIETERAIQVYHLNNIKNNFASNVIINMNNGIPEDEDRAKIEKDINNKFAGENNAGRLMITFNDSVENAPTIEKLDTDNIDMKFLQLAKDTQRNIFIAHRVTSPILFGVVPENTGFSKAEYVQAFEVFRKTIIAPYQKMLCSSFKKIYDTDFEILNFNISDDVQQMR